MQEKPTTMEKVSGRPQDDAEIDLLDLVRFYLSKSLYIIVCFVVGAVVAGCITKFAISPTYQSTSKLYIISSSQGSVVDLTALNIGTELSSDYQELLKLRPVYEDVIDKLKLDYTVDEVAGMVAIEGITDTRVLKITVTSTDPQEAMDIANEMAKEAVVFLPKIMECDKPNIAENAILPTQKSGPSLKKNTAIGALACTVLCLGVLTVLYLMDDTLRDAEDLEKEFGVMPLAVIPEGMLNDQ